MSIIRINKYIARAGICSRREADRLIESGKVKINGQKATLGTTVNETDTVTVNGKTIQPQEQKIYIAFHKPYGVITTTDPNSPNNVLDYVKTARRVYPIGRLDVQSSGLLLLTNDGEIVNTVLKSKNKQEKEYLITLNKPITEEHIQKLQDGIILDGRKTLPARVKKINDRQIDMVLIQGMNRQIRRMCEQLGYEVKILKRIRVGNILLKDLPRGKWRHLTAKEVASLKG